MNAMVRYDHKCLRHNDEIKASVDLESTRDEVELETRMSIDYSAVNEL